MNGTLYLYWNGYKYVSFRDSFYNNRIMESSMFIITDKKVSSRNSIYNPYIMEPDMFYYKRYKNCKSESFVFSKCSFYDSYMIGSSVSIETHAIIFLQGFILYYINGRHYDFCKNKTKYILQGFILQPFYELNLLCLL